ncbi:MAG TPA: S9 family peptidase [Thermoprotei archaeon]|nr:S9 family peptidase [Thermoprotei archaeon]
MGKISWDENTFSRFSYVDNVTISRDGRYVAYVLTKANMKKNKYERTVVIEDLKTGGRSFIEDAFMPVISPRGDKIVYLRAKEENKERLLELWLADLRTMGSKKLIEAKVIDNVQWNEDNRRILIRSRKRLEDEDLIFDQDVPVWFDSFGFFSGEKTLFWIYDTEGEEVIDEIEAYKFSSAIWHGDKVLYASPHNNILDFKFYDVYLYSEGSSEKVLEGVSFVPIDSNGKNVLLYGKPKKIKRSEHDYLYLWDLNEVVPITEKYGYENFTGKITSSGAIYFSTYKEGRITLERVQNGELISIVDEPCWVTYFDVSDNDVVALIKESDVKLSEVYVWKDGEIRQITDYNGLILDKLKVRPIRHFRYKSLDLEIDGWYIKPDIKRGEKAPVIVFVHGGPKGMYGYRFRYEMQLLADKGFFIVFTNPRGSTGYSEDFALRVLERVGLEDFQDILNGIKAFLDLEPQADPERVGITGISYGGFMTNWALTQSNMFKAGISENGISYWLTSYAFSDIGLWFDREIIGDNPLENENYRKLSPIFYANNVKAPILIIHSLEDYRCPLDQSVMFYHVLKDLGKEAYIAIFKRGAHGHSIRGSPKHRAKRYKLIVEFFMRKLMKGEEGFPIEEIIKDIGEEKK